MSTAPPSFATLTARSPGTFGLDATTRYRPASAAVSEATLRTARSSVDGEVGIGASLQATATNSTATAPGKRMRHPGTEGARCVRSGPAASQDRRDTPAPKTRPPVLLQRAP